MGSGKGGGQAQQQGPMQTTSTVSQSNLPEYARPYFENIMQRSEQIGATPYQPYTGERVQDFKEDQYAGINAVRDNVGSYQPSFDAASGNFGQAGSTFGGAGNTFDQAGGMLSAAGQIGTGTHFDPTAVSNSYSAQNMTPKNWTDSGVASSYMSPYMQNVVDIQKREAMRQQGIQGINLDNQAQQAGALGGYRDGVVQAEANRNNQMQLDDIQAKGLQDAYSQGIGAFNQDRTSQLSANQMNNQYGQAQSSLGLQAGDMNNKYNLASGQLDLQGGQLALGAGQGMAGLGSAQTNLGQAQTGLGTAQMQAGQAQQQAGLNDANALLGIGGMHQALDQQRLDTAYQDFISQRDYDRQNLNWQSGILRGVPVTANSSVSGYTSGAAPSQGSQIAGLGLGAAGLAKMMG